MLAPNASVLSHTELYIVKFGPVNRNSTHISIRKEWCPKHTLYSLDDGGKWSSLPYFTLASLSPTDNVLDFETIARKNWSTQSDSN